MSALVKINTMPLSDRQKLLKELIVKTTPNPDKKTIYNKNVSFETFLVLNDEYVAIPFSYFYQYINCGFPNDNISYPKADLQFKINLLDRQKSIRQEALDILNESRSIVIAVYCGFGKTIFTNYLAAKIGLKIIVVCHRLIIIDQWYKSFLMTYGIGEDKIQIISTKTKINPDADIYIINAITLPKRKPLDFINCGIVIIDELHALCTPEYTRGFNYLFPKYLIGLTATPVRSDGQDRVIELFCGLNIIYRPLCAIFNVYLIQTGFTPTVKKNTRDGLDWNSVLSSQSTDINRNKIIINVIRYFRTRNILVLCKRKAHAKILQEELRKHNESVDVYMGSDRIVNYDCRILLSTCSKAGVGFDAPKLDMLIIASDVEENFIQYLGRIFRKEWHFPIVIDLIDNFWPLRKHSQTRINIYKDAGGCVKNFKNYFHEFDEWISIYDLQDQDDCS